MRLVIDLYLGAMVGFLLGCAGRTSSETLAERQAQSRPRSATYGSDHFFDAASVRPMEGSTSPDDFFFQKCRITDRRMYPAMNVWECEGGAR